MTTSVSGAATTARPIADLALGLRLSLGVRRGSWLRLVLTAVGTAVGVVVLLFAASVPHILDRHHDRSVARNQITTPVPGVHPLQDDWTSTTFHGASIQLHYVHGDAASPHPPGLRRLPGPGEVAVSPALAHLLDSEAGALLRPRFPGHRVAVIGSSGLYGPADLTAYVGADSAMPHAGKIYGYGEQTGPRPPVPTALWLLLVVGVVVLLFPVFVFVATSSRLAGAERERRLAAIRLVGADAGQVRRIAAGESVLGSLVGLLLGGGLFLALRPLIGRLSLDGESVFGADVVPSLPLIVLIVVALPVLAVGATLFALRHTVIEPLGVVRQSRPPRRRLWWRLLVVLAGAGLLGLQARNTADNPSTVAVVAGVVLLLLGVPALLPWLLQLVVGRAESGSPARQLATGRLRLDTGTPARVVAGVAVVLAGAVALFTLLAAAQKDYGIRQPRSDRGIARVELTAANSVQATALTDRIRATPGVQAVGLSRVAEVTPTSNDNYEVSVMSCPELIRFGVTHETCRDGEAFLDGTFPRVGRLRLTDHHDSLHPTRVRPMAYNEDLMVDGVVTPGAVPAELLRQLDRRVAIRYDNRHRDTIERIQNAAAPLGWRADVANLSDTSLSTDQKTYATIRRTLLAGAVLTLGMAAATMLVLAIDQIAQRRRPLAVLSASGVPRSVLTRSVLWQNAIPLVLAIVVADAIGLLLGAFMLRASRQSQQVAWGDLGLLTGLTLAAAAVATALTLPSIRRATRPTMLRSE